MTNKTVLHNTLKNWLPLAAVIVISGFTIYATVQQNYRQSANDPQIQIAEDIATAIAQGTAPDTIAPPTGSTDIAQSLSPWVMIYDSTNKLVGTTAILDGKTPSYPSSVFDQVKTSGKQDRVTWQPEAGVRQATVVVPYSAIMPATDASSSPQTVSGYIVAGRNIVEIEKRESQLAIICYASMLFSLILTFLIVWLFQKMEHQGITVTETKIEITKDVVE